MTLLRGPLFALLAALLFGISPPLAKVLVGQTHPQLLAGLLYASAAVVLSAAMVVRSSPKEARLRRSDAPAMLAVTVFGGVIAPVLLLVGLERVTGVAGSLLLNLEAVFTMALLAHVLAASAADTPMPRYPLLSRSNTAPQRGLCRSS